MLDCPYCETKPDEMVWDRETKRWRCVVCNVEDRLTREYLSQLPILDHHVFSHAGCLVPATLRLELNGRTRIWLSELYDGFDTAIVLIQSHYRSDGWLVTDVFNR